MARVLLAQLSVLDSHHGWLCSQGTHSDSVRSRSVTAALRDGAAPGWRSIARTNRFAPYALVGAAPSWLLFYWLLCNGSWNPFQIEFTSNFYDVQAQSFLHGTFSMPERVLQIEGFFLHGHYYMYFGPFLAILHLPVVAFWPQTSGHLSGVSLLIADAIVLAASAGLFIRIRTLLGRTDPPRFAERVALTLFVVTIGAGSVVLFQSSYSSVYLETELWAIALALLACYVGLGVITAPSRSGVVWLGVLTLACVSTRLSVGLGVLCLVALLFVAHLVTSWTRRTNRAPYRWLSLTGVDVVEGAPSLPWWMLGAVGVPLGVVTLVNWAKFGGPLAFSIPWNRQVFASSGLAEPGYVAFVRQHPSLLSLSFIPHTLWWYLRPDAVSFSSLFPFVNFAPIQGRIGGALLAGVSPTTSLTASSPALLVASCVGIALAIAPRRTTSPERSPAIRRIRPLLLAGLASCIGVLALGVIANRYMGDMVPLLVVSGALGANALVIWWARPARSSKTTLRRLFVGSLFVFLLVWSVWINASLTYVYSRTVPPQVPLSARHAFEVSRVRLHSLMSGGPTPGVFWGGPLPQASPLGTLYVEGDCRAVFEQSSETPVPGTGWIGIEWSAAAGHFVLTVHEPRPLTPRALPLVVAGDVNGDLDVVALRELPNDQYEVAFLSQRWGRVIFGSTWIASAPQRWPSSGIVHLNIVLSTPLIPSLREVRVAIGDSVLLYDNFAIHPAHRIVVGSLPGNLFKRSSIFDSVAPVYPDHLAQSKVFMPLCDALVRK